MSKFFDWIDEVPEPPDMDMIALMERLNEVRARRRGLDLKIEKNMKEYEELDTVRRIWARMEDDLDAELDRRKKGVTR